MRWILNLERQDWRNTTKHSVWLVKFDLLRFFQCLPHFRAGDRWWKKKPTYCFLNGWKSWKPSFEDLLRFRKLFSEEINKKIGNSVETPITMILFWRFSHAVIIITNLRGHSPFSRFCVELRCTRHWIYVRNSAVYVDFIMNEGNKWNKYMCEYMCAWVCVCMYVISAVPAIFEGPLLQTYYYRQQQ